MSSRSADHDDARLPPAVASVLVHGETVFLCERPGSLPPPGTPAADFVALPLALAWLYPDSLLLVDALEFARRGVILFGPFASMGAGMGASGGGGGEPTAVVTRLGRLLRDLHLRARWHDGEGRPLDEAAAAAALAAGTAVVRAEKA